MCSADGVHYVGKKHTLLSLMALLSVVNIRIMDKKLMVMISASRKVKNPIMMFRCSVSNKRNGNHELNYTCLLCPTTTSPLHGISSWYSLR